METPPTANSVALSPDMLTLFLIDNGRALPFDLNHKNGIVIGTLNGQLTVATALPDISIPPENTGGQDPDQPDEGPGPEEGPIKRLIPRPRRLLRLSTRTAQWTMLFVREKLVISIIGASDIDTSIIGASDIDTSLIGASDIDTSLTRRAEAPAEPAPADMEAQVVPRPNCLLYSFRIGQQSINIKRAGDLLLIQY